MAKRIQDLQPKDYPTHYRGHSLSLSLKDTTKNCELLPDTIDTAKEVVTLIKISPKRGNLLGEIKENLEVPESAAKGIIGLCPTRWTVRASCFQRILDNYAALLQEWMISLDERLQSDIRGRIIGSQGQKNTFDLFFGLIYRQIYFESIDLMVNAIEQRFEQPSFAAYAKMESLLVKALSSQDNSRELQFMEISYADDVDVGMLTAQLKIFERVTVGEGFFYVLTAS